MFKEELFDKLDSYHYRKSKMDAKTFRKLRRAQMENIVLSAFIENG